MFAVCLLCVCSMFVVGLCVVVCVCLWCVHVRGAGEEEWQRFRGLVLSIPKRNTNPNPNLNTNPNCDPNPHHNCDPNPNPNRDPTPNLVQGVHPVLHEHGRRLGDVDQFLQ